MKVYRQVSDGAEFGDVAGIAVYVFAWSMVARASLWWKVAKAGAEASRSQWWRLDSVILGVYRSVKDVELRD